MVKLLGKSSKQYEIGFTVEAINTVELYKVFLYFNQILDTKYTHKKFPRVYTKDCRSHGQEHSLTLFRKLLSKMKYIVFKNTPYLLTNRWHRDNWLASRTILYGKHFLAPWTCPCAYFSRCFLVFGSQRSLFLEVHHKLIVGC